MSTNTEPYDGKELCAVLKGPEPGGFLDAYVSDARCAETLFRWRWPQGSVCPACGHTDGHTEVKIRGLLQCRHCRHQGSLTAGTVLAYSELPLTIWFLAMYLLTQQKNALSAPELMRHLGVSYPAAWSLNHRLRQVMHERDAQRKLALHSTDNKVSDQQLPCYLADFCYRFNRRFDLAAMLPSQGDAAAPALLMRYRLLDLVEVHWRSGLGFRFHWGERPCLMRV